MAADITDDAATADNKAARPNVRAALATFAREVLVMGVRSGAAATAYRCDEKSFRLWPWTEI
ncbi:hypothetical protein [Mycobacterium sp. 1245801.1]|uniref:hypothetical protein n=1 Tax=Mycobacterium sp. 1245801.1 TaxID=1834075 RepID=UPI0009F5F3F6|nr:hypothetical protein [Mycobacterium sp. 1245801.1]